MKKACLVALAGAIFACGLPGETWAQGERGTVSEAEKYAARESAASGLQEFRGGCPGPDGPMIVVLVLTLPIWLPIFGLYKLGEVTVKGIGSLFETKPAPKDHPPVPTEPRRAEPGTKRISSAFSVSPCLG